jgi:hypothetical protein
VAILTGSSALTRIAAGPSSPAIVLTTPARPGNSPLAMASSANGTLPDDSLHPPGPRPPTPQALKMLRHATIGKTTKLLMLSGYVT